MTAKTSLPPLERLLNLFTEVRKGEAASALLLALNIFLILTAYYILKPVREALILSGSGGAEIKSYVAAGQTLLLLGAVPLYAWLWTSAWLSAPSATSPASATNPAAAARGMRANPALLNLSWVRRRPPYT